MNKTNLADSHRFLTPNEISQFIAELEASVTHSALCYRRANLWPMARNYISGSFSRQNRKVHDSFAERNKIIRYCIAFLTALIKVCFGKKPTSVCFKIIVTDKIYQVKIGNHTIDRVFCGLKENNLHSNFLIIDTANMNFVNLEAKTYNYTEAFFFTGRCISLSIADLFVRFITTHTFFAKIFNTQVLIDELRIVCEACQNKGLSINLRLLLRNVLSVYFHSIWISYYFRKHVIGSVHQANSFDPIGTAINIAASMNNIETVCHQHGGQSKSNPYFNKWSLEIDSMRNPFCRTYTCWDQDSSESIRAWKINGITPQIILAENKWLSISKRLVERSPELRKHDKLFVNFFNVVVTLQPSFQISIEVLQELLNYDQSIKLWIRFHPSMNHADRHPVSLWSKGLSRVEIQKASYFTLPELFAISKLHITASSSSVMEAANAEVFTIFLSENACSYFNSYIEAKQAVYLDSGTKLQEILSRQNIERGENGKNHC